MSFLWAGITDQGGSFLGIVCCLGCPWPPLLCYNSPLSDMHFANMFSLPVACPLIFLTVSSKSKRFYNFLFSFGLCFYSKKSLPNPSY